MAEELRLRIATETGIGVELLSTAVNGCWTWPSLKELFVSNKKLQRLDDPGINEIDSFKGLVPPTDADWADAVNEVECQERPNTLEKLCAMNGEDLLNMQFYNDLDCLQSSSLNGQVNTFKKKSKKKETVETSERNVCSQDPKGKELNVLAPIQCSTPNPKIWNKSFDDCFSSQWGPGPGLILEALTMTQAHEGFDMERMETIGDSLLKLVISIFVYGQSTGSRKCTEGTLSVLRMRQISNRNLYRLGRKAELGSAIVAEAFDLKTNFLPPCVSLVGDHNNKRVNQMVSDKNIADSVEALTGAYLLACGVAGAMKFLKWIGLSIIPDGLENNVNPVNGFPRLAACFRLPSPENGEEMLNHLYSGLEQLEATIKYTFRDKTLLIEALSHASYFPNRLTVSYQRLEFLGDAVLGDSFSADYLPDPSAQIDSSFSDYRVTRVYFDDERKYSPAGLTDLRSATVNNATFAVLAVRHGFHHFLKHMSPTLEFSLDKFIRIQNDNNHQILDDVSCFIYIFLFHLMAFFSSSISCWTTMTRLVKKWPVMWKYQKF